MTWTEERSGPTIGVFDSGFGGLTVLRALLPLIPGAHCIYVGDTARLPYGSKSQKTIARYAVESAAFLERQGAEMLVVACNTASALAMDELRASLTIPVVGVIEPGVQAAQRAAASETGPGFSPDMQPRGKTGLQPQGYGASDASDHANVLVLATAATVHSHAYAKACAALGLVAHEKACPLLVPLVEEGWIDHPVTAEVARIYLTEALAAAPLATTLLLGCTHYPLLEPLIARTLRALGHPLAIVDAATATARAAAQGMHRPPPRASDPLQPATTTFYATDSVEKFQRLGTQFLGQPLPEVHLLDLGG